jgi:DNA-binding protein HU-beta
MRYASHFVPGLDGWRGPMRAACRETQRSHRSGVMLAHGSGAAVRASVHAVGRGEAHERQSSIAARTRSVTSAAVTFHSNGTEISNSGYDVIRTANLRRSGVATIQPSKSFLRCLPGGDHSRFDIRPAIPWNGVGIEDRDGHGCYYRGSGAAVRAPARCSVVSPLAVARSVQFSIQELTFPLLNVLALRYHDLVGMDRKGRTMTQSQIVQALAEKCEVSKKVSQGLLAALSDTAISEVKKNGVFVLPGIGRLVRVDRKARMGRNPATGEAIKIAAKKAVKFRIAKAAKDAIVPPKKPKA